LDAGIKYFMRDVISHFALIMW